MNQNIDSILLNELIGKIYDAALDINLWKGILVSICELVDADEGALLFYDQQSRSRNFVITAFNQNNDDFVSKHFDEEIHTLRYLFSSTREGTLLSREDMTKKLGQGYEKYVGDPANIPERKALESRAGISLINEMNVVSAISFLRRSENQDFSIAHITSLETLTPHIVQAIHIHNYVSSLNKKYKTIRAALDAMLHSIFLLDKKGQVTYTNNAASELLASGCGLTLGKNGFLHHTNLQESERITHIFETLINTNSDVLHLAVNCTKGKFPLQLSFMPIHHEDSRRFSESGAYAALFVRNPNAPLILSKSHLCTIYKLSNAEFEVAQILLNEPDSNKVAKLRSVSKETVRRQLKTLMQKTKTHSQVELIQLLVSLAT